jgi:hypothetical protein
MENFKKWKTRQINRDDNYKFNCFRCDTKNTHATIIGGIHAIEENEPLFDEEKFLFLICSTCGAFTIEHNYYKGTAQKLPKPPAFKGTRRSTGDIITKNIRNKLVLEKSMYFPFSFSTENVPKFLKYDYLKMNQCFQFGSTEGVSVHCRRILDKIFSSFEKKFIDEPMKPSDIKTRVKKITEKCPYFKIINDSIKNLKGVVSTIVHNITDEIEIKEELKIDSNSFKEITDFLDALLKIYELEFSINPKLEKKYMQVKNK